MNKVLAQCPFAPLFLPFPTAHNLRGASLSGRLGALLAPIPNVQVGESSRDVARDDCGVNQASRWGGAPRVSLSLYML